MKKTRFTEAQIFSILQENETGISAPELSRRHGVDENTIYAWKTKYAGMALSNIGR